MDFVNFSCLTFSQEEKHVPVGNTPNLYTTLGCLFHYLWTLIFSFWEMLTHIYHCLTLIKNSFNVHIWPPSLQDNIKIVIPCIFHAYIIISGISAKRGFSFDSVMCVFRGSSTEEYYVSVSFLFSVTSFTSEKNFFINILILSLNFNSIRKSEHVLTWQTHFNINIYIEFIMRF